ncbi:MAG: methionyl-tRNA formyltransferase [Firmicutes bacterium]|nr:methionyl-tRNA formyltransferase [Bacillota bacterium]
MRVVYMGTPDFAVPALVRLREEGYEIPYVVTQPDAVRNRGKKISFSPVKEKALELGIEVLQPEKIKKNEEFLEKIRDAAPDVIVVAAYGKLLPESILNLPPKGCVNIHGSLLPRHRGASPIQASIAAGDEETGVTIMYMEKGLDTGNMIAKASTPIDRKTGSQLHDELAVMGAELLVDTLPKLDEITAEEQDDSLSTYAPMITKQDGHIDFESSPVTVERKIRAYDPWPGSFAYIGDKMYKIWKAEVVSEKTLEEGGTVIREGKDYLDIACGGEILRITEIQAPGKKRVSTGEFLRGNTIEIGTVLR